MDRKGFMVIQGGWWFMVYGV